MNKFFISIISICIFFFVSCSSKQKETGNNIYNKVVSTHIYLLSTDKLVDTRWTASYSNKDHYTNVVFTDSFYIEVYATPKDTFIHVMPYYISYYKNTKFDLSKVGKKSEGDFLHYMDDGTDKMVVMECTWFSPTKMEFDEEGVKRIFYSYSKKATK